MTGLNLGSLAAAFAAVLLVRPAAAMQEHAICDEISLDGDWEMAYSPFEYLAQEMPEFAGVKVRNAVPGYWEDMVGEFRRAGMTAEFRGNPWYERQTFPIRGSAGDLTLPGVYGCFFYRRSVCVDRGGPALLRFEGVRNQVHAWVNGRFVGFRAGFSTPFQLSVRNGVLHAGTNEVVLAVCNNPNLGYCDQVSGLTTRGPFRSTGGVNGHLALAFPKADLGDVYVTTAKDLKTFTVHVSGTAGFSYEIWDGERILTKGQAKGDFTLKTDGYAFWSPENPKRYELRLAAAGGTYAQKFGIRRLVADGEKLRLNGSPVYLRGVTEHCYFPVTVHLPRDLDYYRMITAKRKELGFNFVRFHTFVPPVEYLEAMDELGMLVHIESPNFVSEPEFAAIVAFTRRHPSVVIYCTGNETRIDRMAEAYLRDVANLVHVRTDALFTPMSAMRAVEYMLIPGKDPVVGSPFPHNRERMARLAAFCDLWTSYPNGLLSYDSLNSQGPRTLDAWGDAYCGKPRMAHEICIDGSYIDLSLERRYPPDSPIVKTGMFSGVRRQLEEKGLLDRAETYFRNSCEWMRRIRKFTLEKLRAADRFAGCDFLGDINTHWYAFGYSVGIMDEFYRMKPGESAENVRRYNSAAVLLCDLGSNFNVVAGEPRRIGFSVSNYAKDVGDARLVVTLADAAGTCVWRGEADCGDLANGKLTHLPTLEVGVPDAATAKRYVLRASVDGLAANEWEVYAFPRVRPSPDPEGLRVVANISEQDLQTALRKGERVLLFGRGPFKALSTSYRIGLAGRCSGNYATVIKPTHAALRNFPHEGFCGWQFRHLLEGGAAVQLEADVPFDPIVDIASSEKCAIRQAMLFEYRVGKGRLLVCSFRLGKSDPAAAWLRKCLVEYAASKAFEPEHTLSEAQLHAVISAPLVSGEVNSDRARNPNDPASSVRAGIMAQP